MLNVEFFGAETVRSKLNPLTLPMIRLIVGYGFLAHGLAKVARGYDAFPRVIAQIGLPMPHLLGWTAITVEVVGGAAFIAGFMVRLASAPMAMVLLVAIFTVHAQYGFSSIKLLGVTESGAQFGPPGYETDLLYLVCIAAVFVNGAGAWSMDGWLRGRVRRGLLQ